LIIPQLLGCKYKMASIRFPSVMVPRNRENKGYFGVQEDCFDCYSHSFKNVEVGHTYCSPLMEDPPMKSLPVVHSKVLSSTPV